MTVHYNNGHTINTNVTSPFSTCTPLSWVDWKKISPSDNETAQLKADGCTASCCYIHHNESKTLAHIEFAPLASSVESREIRATCTARPSNIFHLFSNTNLIQTQAETITTCPSAFRVDSTSGQYPGLPRASQAAASPT